ncbi:hypothetical protein HPB50_009752 [Hyalomma asiaticum]|uniref:Uncharacterized protein n=1 Tax=Hyalomma asiaticum TaxID=266040 RepID=A0ACB7RZH2_HYAAI|nr:hypothetical protein HPB50_009752 [Hyalomma asiaticum]
MAWVSRERGSGARDRDADSRNVARIIKGCVNVVACVSSYYQDIKMMPAISDQDMNAMLAEESRLHAHEFNTNVALHELYKYAYKYTDQLLQTLEEDEFSQKNKLARKLSQVNAIMNGESEA